jgi:hypothetical protein
MFFACGPFTSVHLSLWRYGRNIDYVWEQGAEENILTQERWSDRRLELHNLRSVAWTTWKKKKILLPRFELRPQ